MFIKCGCQNCGQNIEFSTDEFQEDHRTTTAVFGQSVPCPSCSNETRLFVTQAPVKPTTQNRRPQNLGKRLTILGIIIAVIAICCAIGWTLNKFADRVGEAVGGGIAAVIVIGVSVFLVVLALCWILFPIIMYFQLKRSNELLERLERNTRPLAEKK